MKIRNVFILTVFLSACSYKSSFKNSIDFINKNAKRTEYFNMLMQNTEASGKRNMVSVRFLKNYQLDSIVNDIYLYYLCRDDSIILQRIEYQPDIGKQILPKAHLINKGDSIVTQVLRWKSGYICQPDSYISINCNYDGARFVLLSKDTILSEGNKYIKQISPHWYFYDSKANYFSIRYYNKAIKKLISSKD